MSNYTITTERAALAPKIAAFDAKLEKLGNELAAINRKALDTGTSLPPKFAATQREREKVAHERAALVQRDNELRMEEIRNQRGRAELDAQIAALGVEKWPTLEAADRLMEALSPYLDHITQAGLDFDAHELRRTIGVIQRHREVLGKLDYLQARRDALGVPADAAA